MVGKGAHVAPFGAVAGREYLQASEPVKEDGDGAEVAVFSQRRPPVIDWLRRRLDEADVIAQVVLQTMTDFAVRLVGDAAACLDG